MSEEDKEFIEEFLSAWCRAEETGIKIALAVAVLVGSVLAGCVIFGSGS